MRIFLYSASAAFFLFFFSAGIKAQSVIYIGRAYGMEKINQDEWMAKEIHISEDKAKNTYMQIGYGRKAACCALTREQTRTLLSALTECANLVPKCYSQRKNMTKDFGSISPNLSARFISSQNGGRINIVFNITNAQNDRQTLVYINPQQIRHIAWLLKDEKLTYMRQ